MKTTVDEFLQMTNAINEAVERAIKEGIKREAERQMPNSLFDALLSYAKESKTLVDYHKSSGSRDGCNWIRIKPTRDGSKGTKFVEISFENNLMEIYHVGIGK